MTRRLALLLSCALGACGLTSDDAVPLHIAINVGQLAGMTQGDFNSVMDRVQLVVTGADGASQTLNRPLEAGEFDPTFDITVEEGETSFAATVVSTDGLPLYEGTTTSTIDRDGFEVIVVPSPVRGVLIAAPRKPQFPRVGNIGNATLYASTLVIRNRGSAELLWRVQPSPSPNEFGIGCDIVSNDDVEPSCLEDTNLLPNGQVTINVSIAVFTGGPVPATGIVFVSSVGGFTVPVTP